MRKFYILQFIIKVSAKSVSFLTFQWPDGSFLFKNDSIWCYSKHKKKATINFLRLIFLFELDQPDNWNDIETCAGFRITDQCLNDRTCTYDRILCEIGILFSINYFKFLTLFIPFNYKKRNHVLKQHACKYVCSVLI